MCGGVACSVVVGVKVNGKCTVKRDDSKCTAI